jgi:Mrp family chromosome partitioning ATPase
MSEAEVKLRALEREAKAQRDLLESYLARFRDASARHDMGAVPAQATIVSQAHASIKPSFPQRGSMSLLAGAATALLALAYSLARALVGTPAGPRLTHGSGGGQGCRHSHRTLRAPREAAGEHGFRPPGAMAPSPRVESRPLRAEAETAAAGFLARLRRSVSASAAEPPSAAKAAPEGLLARFRKRGSEDHAPAIKQEPTAEPKGGTMPVLKTNDLRHYLNQRLAVAAEAAGDQTRKEQAATRKCDDEKIGPVLKSLDAVVNHVVAAGRGGAPRALLVAGVSAKVDATRDAIAIARALVDRREQVVLVDLARGPAAISGPLELPRAPGLIDVTAGRSGFEDVVKIDATTALQVIPAGNPKLAVASDENERFTPVFEALTQAYDCVVLHADLEAVRKLGPALKFELPLAIAVLEAGTSPGSAKTSLQDLSTLGCPVVVYEQGGKQPRAGLFSRLAAG